MGNELPEGDEPRRYEFTLWALEVEHLPLDAEASGVMVGFFLKKKMGFQDPLRVMNGGCAECPLSGAETDARRS